MMWLARGTQQFARRLSGVRWDSRRSFMTTVSGVENKQKPHAQSFSSHHKPTSVLSPEEKQVFETRFSTIWEGIMALEKTPKWDQRTRSLPSDIWFSRISTHIPVHIKRILISPHPPTPTEMKRLVWLDTTDAGVLIWWTEATGKQESEENMLYISSATAHSPRGGLTTRKLNMLSQLHYPHDEALKRKIKLRRLSLKGQFGTLFMVPFENNFNGDSDDVRALSILTRLLLMIWLGAVDEGLRSKTKDLVPWKLGSIQYIGLATDNPLMIDIKSNKPNRRERRKKD